MAPDQTIHPILLGDAIARFNDAISLARSANTARTYKAALKSFTAVLADHRLDVNTCLTNALPEDAIIWFAVDLKDTAPNTERLFLTAVKGFYEFLVAERLAQPNLPRIKLLIRQRGRRPGIRLPQFPRHAIEDVLEYVKNITLSPAEDETARLIDLRDRAFLITLADTGLRVHEACKLRRGDIDRYEGKALLIGKGNKQAVVRFSQRSLKTINEYLAARQALDGGTKKALIALPVFARHDPAAGKKVLPITTRTGSEIVTRRVREALGEAAVGTITPHSFRHYFVTMVLRGTGNIKIAQELARHSNIAITQRYAHLSDDELDKGYHDAIDRDL